MRNQAIIAVGLLLVSCGSGKRSEGSPTTDAAATPAAALAARLDSVARSGHFYFGHHDDTAYGVEWKYEDVRSDVRDVTGEYPGLMNWDLGLIELDSARNLDKVPFSFIAGEIRKQDARGGVNAISWHPRNVMTGGDSWDTTGSPLHELAGNREMADSLDAWITRAARFIGDLRNEEGERIPVVFRPWHENNGTWFWWGSANATPEEYIDLWKRTRSIFDREGIDNVVWAYSPDRVDSKEKFLLTYPGDDYVDLIGSDIYHFNGEEGREEFEKQVRSQLSVVEAEAKERGKLMAFTESGLEGVTIPDWYTNVLLPAVSEFPVAYVCVWRNANKEEKAGHYYVPYKGHPAEEDFKAFHANGKAIFVK
ncbi:MAG: beta-mannosidase [Bacteroides sp.]|nr:beta-mannosidase [Bacteroides sp.]